MQSAGSRRALLFSELQGHVQWTSSQGLCGVLDDPALAIFTFEEARSLVSLMRIHEPANSLRVLDARFMFPLASGNDPQPPQLPVVRNVMHTRSERSVA